MKILRVFFVSMLILFSLNQVVVAENVEEEGNKQSTIQTYDKDLLANTENQVKNHSTQENKTDISGEQPLKEENFEENEMQSSVEPNSSEVPDVKSNQLDNILSEQPIVPMAVPSADDTVVNTWNQFRDALQEAKIKNIFVNVNLTATSNVIVNGNKNIEFNNQSLDIAARSITVNAPYELVVSNIQINGTTANRYIFSGTGTLTFKNSLKSISGNRAVIANQASGKITLDSVNMEFDTTSKNEVFKSKYFTITNSSKVNSVSTKFFGLTNNVDRGTVLINNQSEVKTTSMKSETDAQVWNIRQPCDFTVDGIKTSLIIEGNGITTADYGGVFLLNADNSTISITNSAKMSVKAWKNSVAVLLQSKYGSLNVDNQSELDIVQEDDGNYNLGAALRFRWVGDMTFNVTNKSKISVDKKKGKATAIRMYGGGNKINISGGSDFIVHNAGDGVYRNGGSDQSNQGIQYTGTSNGDVNYFMAKDDSSNISITSDYGPAIDADKDYRRSMSIDVNKGAYFVARGSTASSSAGIFNSGSMIFKMNSVKYFDFKNTNKGSIFSTANNSSGVYSFENVSSDISVWNKNDNLNSTARYTWNNATFSLSGANLANLSSTNIADMRNKWGATTNYSRMSANNQTPIVDELRVPTNADKSLFAHISIPQGKYDDPESANTGEASASLAVKDQNGKSIQQLTGITNELSIYGEPKKPGWVQATLPNNQFLTENHKVSVTAAWLGNGKKEDSNRVSTTKDIKTKEEKVFAVVPPSPAILGNKVESTTTTLKGKGDPNTNVFLNVNGVQSSVKTTTASDGSFTLILPNNLKKGDKLQILLQDRKGLASGVINPPATNTAIGNIEPTADLPYHDTVFPAGTVIEVTGSLSLAEYPQTFDFGKQKIGNKEQTFWPKITGNLKVIDTRNNPEGWQVKLTETQPLTFNQDKLKSVLYYQDGKVDKVLSENAIVVFEKAKSSDGTYIITNDWSETKKKGIKIKIPVEKQKIGDYKAILKWSLEAVPKN